MRIRYRTIADNPLPAEVRGTAEDYQTATRNLGFTRGFSKAHETHYEPWVQRLVADAPRHTATPVRVPLPRPEPRLLDMSLGEAIARRHSGRVYGPGPIQAGQLSTLLTGAVGVRSGSDRGRGPGISRNVTNAGNLGSVEVYPIVQRVDGVGPGIYHFDTVEHDLALITAGQFDDWLREVVFFQEEFADGAAVLILTSAIGRLTAKYGPRGYRFALFDVGHVSQNVYLLATAMGLQVCATAGFVDESLNAVLDLDGLDECASLVLVLGATPETQTGLGEQAPSA